MNASDVMTSPAISVKPDMPLIDAVRLMLQQRISGLPVVDDSGELVGILTEGDLLRRGETGTERHRPRWIEFLRTGKLAEEYTRTHGRKVEEVMTCKTLTVPEDAPLETIVDLMERRHIKRVRRPGEQARRDRQPRRSAADSAEACRPDRTSSNG